MGDDVRAEKCRCGHDWTSHPMDGQGRRVCSRAINELPSCEECAEPMRNLRDQVIHR